MTAAAHPAAPAGLLVVNADDWGGHAQVTDAIDRCFQAGAITSSTGMLHMPDSERAADLARELHRPIGLHLNLTEPFAGRTASSAVRDRQLAACRHFADLRRRRWSYDPRVRSVVADAIHDQVDAFQGLYGSLPTHVDSHHHVHVCPDVFLSAAMPRGLPLRTTASPLPGRGSLALNSLRRLKHLAIAARFLCTSAFFGIGTLHADFGGKGLASVLELSRTRPVEVMVHPSFEGELPLLLSESWARLVADVPGGSYEALVDTRPAFTTTLEGSARTPEPG